jgi:ABC-type transporter Mla subunit MlaD
MASCRLQINGNLVMADTTQNVDIDSTIAALQGGLTSIPPEAAVSAIEAWQQQLQGTAIAETLGQLKLALTGGGSGVSGVRQLLVDLSSQAETAAGSATGSDASKLQQLAKALSNVSNSIS